MCGKVVKSPLCRRQNNLNLLVNIARFVWTCVCFNVIPEVNGLITVTRVWSDCLLSVLPSLYRRMPGSAVCCLRLPVFIFVIWSVPAGLVN
ncbi:hypothetical protein PHYPO_G00181640 [Pangasianodon hypophthalmus]|uniref:Uncharacterized protein n=1 Tax=Pangasianodon hypophthalmus TaxID=310915 RepID=A0A5N5PSH1_PANHP|nr:hypothetical protein PHYPO_G00181640 [Pangasianodon hypophthalmus]